MRERQESNEARYYRNLATSWEDRCRRAEARLTGTKTNNAVVERVQTALANPTTLDVVRKWVGWGMLIAILLILTTRAVIGQEVHRAHLQNGLMVSVTLWKHSCSVSNCHKALVTHAHRAIVDDSDEGLGPVAVFLGPEPSEISLGAYKNEFYWHCPLIEVDFRDREGFFAGRGFTLGDGRWEEDPEVSGGTVTWRVYRIQPKNSFTKIEAAINTDACRRGTNPYAARIPR